MHTGTDPSVAHRVMLNMTQKLGTKLPKNSVGVEVEVEVGAMRSIQIFGEEQARISFSHFEGVMAFPCKISFEHLKRRPPF